jgi:hypothetical protein
MRIALHYKHPKVCCLRHVARVAKELRAIPLTKLRWLNKQMLQFKRCRIVRHEGVKAYDRTVSFKDMGALGGDLLFEQDQFPPENCHLFFGVAPRGFRADRKC